MNLRKIFAGAAATMMLVAFAACGKTAEGTTTTEAPAANNGTITVTHDLGSVEVPVNPEKFAVYDFGALDTIKALGVETELAVPSSSVPEYLEEYADENKYTNIGGIKEADIEAVAEFEPDVIIISGRISSAYDELSEIAPVVYVATNSEDYVNSYKENMAIMGEIFDKEEEVKEILDGQMARVDEIKALADSRDDKALMILTNDGSISGYGPGSRYGFIYDDLDVKAVDEEIEASTHGSGVSFEYIAEKNPDIIFVIDRTQIVGGDNEGSATLDTDLVNGTTAAQNDKIIYLDPTYWYLSGGGLESFSMMIEDIAKAYN